MTLIGFKIANETIEWSQVRDLWLLADETDAFDVGWNFDHVLPIRAALDEPCLEGWTMLAALAEATDRVRLGCMVGATSYRAPALLAKMAAMIDIVSDGRLELGLGAGWHTAEAEAYDLHLPEKLSDRFDLFDESLEVIMSLLRNERTDFSGAHLTITDAPFNPKGPQVPPPLTIGGTGPKRTLRSVARFADWWNLPFFDPSSYAESREVLAAHCDAVGRDPGEIRHSCHVLVPEEASIDEIAEVVGSTIATGIDQPIVYIPPPFDPGLMTRTAEAVGQLDVDHR